ncbi:hypothetical protein KKB64_02680 [Patescibacteria group bacterium]|nr:hypothetical protein [Patescibacteria group bacterium]MBU1472663.1 hypothetical protein [Patescibacteria group bacterium]MBU2459901.1 hypothetical protein [Patescibacteria group bacterium]MBU2544709.1 hypothetical protein [Patescibacteria group bacterium]
MINWNTDEKRLKKEYPEEYKRWRITQLINYGLEREKLDTTFLKAHWTKIKDRLAPDKRKTIEWLIWNKPWQKQSDLRKSRNNFSM